MSSQATLPGIPTATSSPASAVGPTHSDLPESKDGESGPGAVHASPSPLPGREREPTTNGTCGRSSTGSSASASLQRSLESRLRARLEGLGSPLYSLTWKAWDMPFREPICALRALGRRTSGKGSGGWPTATAQDSVRQYSQEALRKFAIDGNVAGHYVDLNAAAQLTGWGTPRATDGNKNVRSQQGALAEAERKGGNNDLGVSAALTGWPTPATPSGGRSVSIEKMDATGRTADGKKHTASLEHAVRFVGWPTPLADSSETRTPESSERRAKAGRPITLSGAASLAAGWATPRVGNNGGIGSPERAADGKARLEDQVQGAGWVTPSARDWKDTPGMATEGVNPDGTKRNRVDQLPRQAAMVAGQEPNTSNVSTEKRGQLSPAFSLWLMGFPAAWALCAGAVTPSSRKSRKSL